MPIETTVACGCPRKLPDWFDVSAIFRAGLKRNLRVGFTLGVMASFCAVMLWSLL